MSASEPHGFIVWVRGLQGPEIQKWTGMMIGANGKPRDHLAAYAVSPEEYALPFEVLERLYPAPKDAAPS
jgi:hypothetical protein